MIIYNYHKVVPEIHKPSACSKSDMCMRTLKMQANKLLILLELPLRSLFSADDNEHMLV